MFVLFHHAFSTQVYWAWIWLEMFFVLSGFLITTILLGTDLTRRRAIVNFLVRRGLRIWPVHYLALIGAIAIWGFYAWGNPYASDTTWWTYFSYLQSTEGDFTFDQGYMDQHATWFRASWSLAVEEQYYLLWPLMILLVRGERAAMVAFCAVLMVGSVYLRATGEPHATTHSTCC